MWEHMCYLLLTGQDLGQKLNFAEAGSYNGNQVLIGSPDTDAITINLRDHEPVKKRSLPLTHKPRDPRACSVLSTAMGPITRHHGGNTWEHHSFLLWPRNENKVEEQTWAPLPSTDKPPATARPYP